MKYYSQSLIKNYSLLHLGIYFCCSEVLQSSAMMKMVERDVPDQEPPTENNKKSLDCLKRTVGRAKRHSLEECNGREVTLYLYNN